MNTEQIASLSLADIVYLGLSQICSNCSPQMGGVYCFAALHLYTSLRVYTADILAVPTADHVQNSV